MKQQVKIYKVKGNPKNPRIIKNDKFKKLVKSIQEFPEMLKLRPIVVDEDMSVLKRVIYDKDKIHIKKVIHYCGSCSQALPNHKLTCAYNEHSPKKYFLNLGLDNVKWYNKLWSWVISKLKQ